MNYTLDEIRKKNLIIFEAKMGSVAYGTSTPESDVDIRGVFVQPIDDIIKFGYAEQVSDSTNDVVFYELKRFLDLLEKNNPNILELLSPPEDCIIHKNPLYDLIIENRDKFITKECKWTFSGYAIQQIKKAQGYNKKINWEESEFTRKGILDFCYILKDGGSVPLNIYLKNLPNPEKSDHRNFGLAKIDHARDLYAMYYLPGSGIIGSENANDVQLSSIPKGSYLEGYLSFNKDGYSSHCKKYSEYQTWLKNRNENRFKMNKAHGKNYDSKNMMHCVRLLTMGIEIAEGKGIVVRRSSDEIKNLMSIRHGEMEFNQLMEISTSLSSKLDESYRISNLPDRADSNIKHQLLYKIRTEIEKSKH